MPDLISEFCAYYHSYNNISPGRAFEQERVLRLLVGSIDGVQCNGIAQLSADDIERFIAAQPVKASTAAKYLKMIRPFARWMYRKGHISAEQLMGIIDIKAPRGSGLGPPRPYSRREIAIFWELLEETFPWTDDKDTMKVTTKRAEWWVRRWQRGASSWKRVYPYARRIQAEAIVALALFGGLRRQEIFDLTIDDMHYENAYVSVLGCAKNERAEREVRVVPMTEPMRVALANWIEFREQVIKPEHNRPWLALWKDRYQEPMSYSGFSRLLRRIGMGYSFHRMRHTYATEQLRAGMPIEILQKTLGHSDISMTLRYTKIGAEDVLHAANQSEAKFSAATTPSHQAQMR